MKIIKASTIMKPIPKYAWGFDETNDRFVIVPFTGGTVPNGKKFTTKPKSYICVIVSGDSQWVEVKFASKNDPTAPLFFDIPGDIILNRQIYTVLLGYNEGFLGGSYIPGYYDKKEKIQYWYCLLQADRPTQDYVVHGTYNGPSLVIDTSDLLIAPNLTRLLPYKFGDGGLKFDGSIKYGEKYEQ